MYHSTIVLLLIQETRLEHQETDINKILKERGTVIHFQLLFSSENSKT